MNNSPLITVYITNHNYGKYLNRAIKSVLVQSFKNFELIVIDDGSNDSSEKIIKRYNNHKKKLKDISDQSISFSDKINRLSKMINVENESLSTIGHNFKEKTKYVLNIDLQI